VDRDPSSGALDYQCGRSTYNGHKGTDFAVGPINRISQGVDVLAAADGTVLRVRDGEPDGLSDALRERARAKTLECGNGLVIDHGNGWTSQYCHLRRGSLRVSPGDKLVAGQPIGLVGLSGVTEFPHLHVTLRRDNIVVDPFSIHVTDDLCGATDRISAWRDQDQSQLLYRQSQIYNAGFSASVPEWAQIQRSRRTETRLSCDAEVLISWVEIFNVRAGDKLSVAIKGPDGSSFLKQEEIFEKSQARAFRYHGKKRKVKCWPSGSYTAHYRILAGPDFKETRSEQIAPVNVAQPR
jgi:hypothetical protein